MEPRTHTINGPVAASDGARPSDDDTPAASVAVITSITTDIATDATTLVEEHGNLFAAEVRAMGDRASRGSIILAMACSVLVIGLLFLLTGLVRLTIELAPTLPEWAAWLLWGGGLMVVGGLAAWKATRTLSKLDFLPRRTLRSLLESWSWLVNRLK
ncbi:MAG: phage holin family protein [Fimbriiglobus sp.]|jgi:hypothetical protein|nr:phage holin family protein [Fimbriiglobus sp.]